ncbi:MAG: hypothetical protein JWM14_198, partial [Chitinophagaceae bacterium]|nr:hypothetical protein [Chitinophagaceae bacterium]
MNKKPIIAFLIPDLKNGGGQRVASILMNNLVSRGYEVVCVVYDAKDAAFILSDQVQVFSMGVNKRNRLLNNRVVSFILKVIRLRTILRKVKPDLVFPMMTSMNIIGLCANKNAAILLNHHTFTKPRTIKYYLVKFLYRYADAVVVPSKGLEMELTNLNRNI